MQPYLHHAILSHAKLLCSCSPNTERLFHMLLLYGIIFYPKLLHAVLLLVTLLHAILSIPDLTLSSITLCPNTSHNPNNTWKNNGYNTTFGHFYFLPSCSIKYTLSNFTSSNTITCNLAEYNHNALKPL